ncbi:MAG: hypothetical protein K0S55_1090 [Clostridia bacterium]|nr:hypothetical protein [Clostridia bacterium]
MYTAKPIYITKVDDLISVRNKYSLNQDIDIQWKKKGGNNLFDLYRINFIDNTADIISREPVSGYAFESCTDFFGPHKILSTSNIDGDLPASVDFTGGNHAYDGGDTGAATAKTSEVRLFTEGREVTGYDGYADFIEIRWINFVQASNTKKADGTGRAVFKESYCMTFDGIKYNVECLLEALEDITWVNYYGLQAPYYGMWDDFAYFHNSPSRKKIAGDISADSLNKTCNLVTLEKGDNLLEVGMTSEGIGNREFLNINVTRGAFTIGSYKKFYFWLVDGTSLTKGDIVGFKGHYRFYGK